MLFISNAYAQAATPAPQPSGASQIFMLLIIFGIMWFFMIRPQQKRAKETRDMQGALKKGDEVLTSGGIMGRIINLNEYAVELEIAKNVLIRVQRPFITAVLPQGTLKAEWSKVEETAEALEDKAQAGNKKAKKKKAKAQEAANEPVEEVKNEEVKAEPQTEQTEKTEKTVDELAQELNQKLEKMAEEEKK